MVCFGGDKRDRTADLLNAIQALSQLSYTPMVLKPLILLDFCVIRLSCSAGRFTGRLPSQLSYTPMVLKPLIILDFCVVQLSCCAGCFTGRLPSQLSYTPRYFQIWNFRGTIVKL